MNLLSNLKIIKILKNISSIKNEARDSNTLTLRHLSKECKSLSASEISTLVQMLKNYPQIERKVMLFNSAPNNYITNNTFYNFGVHFNICIFIRFLERDKENINSFLIQKEKVEELTYKGDYNLAIQTLDIIDDKFGITLWSIDVRIALMSIKGPDTSKNILNEIDAIANGKPELKHYKSILAQKYISLNTIDILTESFADTAKEYRSNGQGAYIDTISTIICPMNYDPERNIDNIVLFSESLNPIDRYIIYKKAFFEYFSYHNNSSHDKIYRLLINSASTHCDDLFWVNLKNTIDNNISERVPPKALEAIKYYTEGLYDETINICTREINSSLSNLALIDILCRSLTYKYHNDDELEFKIDISSPLIKSIVNGICLILSSHDSSTSVQNNIENGIVKLYSFEFPKAIEPVLFSIHPYFNHDRLYHSTRYLYCTPYVFTPKFCYFASNNKLEHSYYPLLSTSYFENISPSRLARIDIDNGLTSKELTIEELLLKYHELKKYNDITKSELLFILSEIYVSRGVYEPLLDIIARDCIKKPHNIIYYPLKNIMNYISSDKSNKGNICIAIFSYLYHSTIDHTYKEVTSEFLEDYLSYYSLKKPSELISSTYNIDELSIFFLKKICVPELMSSLIEITSNRELLVERLKLIQFLTGLDINQDESLSIEENNIVSELLSHRLTAQHEKSKITINTDGIIKLRSNDYKALLIQYYIVSRKFNQVKEEYPDFAKDEGNINDMLGNILFSLHTQVNKDFILNNDFGVVRSLSSEIRHGVLPNQIRSVFEAYNLVTIVSSNGDYSSNLYWKDYFSRYLHEEAVNHIDATLKWFSKEVDSIIKEVTEWPKVRTIQDGNNNHIFHFDFNRYGMQELIERTCSNINSEDSVSDESVISFIRDIEAFCWSELQSSFDDIKARLNEYLKPKFRLVFEQFKWKISENFNTVVLDKEIDRCEHKLMEEIAYIETWFKKPTYILHEVKFNIVDVIHSSLDCIKAIYEPKTLNIEFKKNIHNGSEQIIESAPALGLVRALLSIYSNCFKHGIDGSDTTVDISIDSHGKHSYIYVKNETTKENIIDIILRDVIGTVDNYSVQDKYGKLVNEGDTGLYKIYRYLFDSYENFRFNVSYEGNIFTQRIGIV